MQTIGQKFFPGNSQKRQAFNHRTQDIRPTCPFIHSNIDPTIHPSSSTHPALYHSIYPTAHPPSIPSSCPASHLVIFQAIQPPTYTYPSILPSIQLSIIHSSIYSSTGSPTLNPSIHIHLPFQQSKCPSIYLSTNPPIIPLTQPFNYSSKHPGIHIFTHLPSYLTISPAIHLSIHPFTYHPPNPPFNRLSFPSVHQPIQLSIHPPIYPLTQLIYPSNQSTNQPTFTFLSIHPSIQTPICPYLPTHPILHHLPIPLTQRAIHVRIYKHTPIPLLIYLCIHPTHPPIYDPSIHPSSETDIIKRQALRICWQMDILFLSAFLGPDWVASILAQVANQSEIIPENCVSHESEIVMRNPSRWSVLQDLPHPKHSPKSARISSPE